MRNKVFYVAMVLSLSPMVLSQVDQEIDQEEDLLAVDSIANEVSFRRPILPPSPSFARIGARLVAAPRSPAKRPQVSVTGPGRGPQQPTSLARGPVAGAALVHNSQRRPDGSYAFNYETGDGQRRQESGLVSSSSAGSIVQTGSWSYTGSDGKLYEVKFIADEFGYRPVGGHLHPAHQQAQRQARLLAGQREARTARTQRQTGATRTGQQGGRNRGQGVRTRQEGSRLRADHERTRPGRPDRQQDRS